MSEANTPGIPPLLKEDDLNPAEKKVLKAFQNGEREVIVHPNGIAGHLPSPEKFTEEHIPALMSTVKEPTAEDWQGEGAVIRAHFLRNLFLGNHGKFDTRLVSISCARIEGMLNLDYCESRFPLNFFWCIFSEGISLQAAAIPELALTKCLIGQAGQPSHLYAPQVQVTTNVSLNSQFIAYGGVYLHSANIGGQLTCDGSHFEKGLNAQSLETGGAVFLVDDFRSNGVVYLDSANIGGQLVCEGGHFEKGLTAQHLKTKECVLLREGFRSNGKVNLYAANIGGPLSCVGGYFKAGLIAEHMKAGGDVLLMEKFESGGKVYLNWANISGQFSCTGGVFEKGLEAQNLKTGKDMFLRGKFESNDVVDLNGANIGGQLDCTGGYFKTGLVAQNLNTDKDVFLKEGFESNGVVNLNGANIGGQLFCPDGHFRKGLFANGLRYQSIYLGGDWRNGLAWLQQIRGDGLQPYEQLMTAYRRMGNPDWAREIGFELEKKRHERSEGLWRAWYSVLKWTIGYGYKPFQSLGWAAGLVAAGFLLFSSGHNGIVSRFVPQYLKTPAFLDNTFLGNEWIPAEVEALESASWTQNRKPPPDYQPFNPMVYSLEAAFPVLPLGQLDKWRPSSLILSGVRWIWTFTGSTLLAILALFGVGALGPNRKNEDDSG
ncbi:MAG: hypothetical protein OXU53_09335 [Deltaproteobacteria bacterium]|nr:hypothetical protein [Deltaproteobacteria bacterium]